MLTEHTVQIQTTNKPQVIIPDLKNKLFMFYGDAGNAADIIVGDQAIKPAIASQQQAQGMRIIPMTGSATPTPYSNLVPVFVTDSDQLYMVGTANDLLHVIIFDDPVYYAVQELISAIQPPSIQPLVDRLDTVIALLNKMARSS